MLLTSIAKSPVISRIMASISSCDVFAHAQGQRQEAIVSCTSGVFDSTSSDAPSSSESPESVTVVLAFCVVLGSVSGSEEDEVMFAVTFADSIVVAVVELSVVVVVVVVVVCTVGSKDKVCTVKPVLSDHIQQYIFVDFQTGGYLLLLESNAESLCFLCYFHSSISNHMSIAISMSLKCVVALYRFICI